MREAEVDTFEKLFAQTQALHTEIGTLSKKSPNDAVNKFKLRFVNLTLRAANELLSKRYKPFADFDSFDQDDLPTNSDVTLILSQYLNCMGKLHADNVETDYSDWYWVIDGIRSDRETSAPQRLGR